MNNLRDIVRRHVEQESLKEYLGDRFELESDEEKERLLNILRSRGEIDRECEEILGAFQREINRNSPEIKKKMKIKILIAAINLVCTAIIGYGINITNWIVVWSVSAVLLVVQIFLFLIE